MKELKREEGVSKNSASNCSGGIVGSSKDITKSNGNG